MVGGGEVKEVEAFSETQIWFHKHLIHFMLAFIITGLPQIQKDWFGWIAILLGEPLNMVLGGTYDAYSLGIQIARWIHRLSAVGLTLVLIPFVVRELANFKKWEIWPECWSLKCFNDGVKQLIDYYLHKKHVEIGKYNLGQKFWTWLAAITLFFMGLSGFIMWFRGYFSADVWRIAHLIHDIGFYIFMIMLPVHAYLAVALPEHRPMVGAMFRTGTLPLEFVKEHHPKWYKKLFKKE